jgi:hypothetical protein
MAAEFVPFGAIALAWEFKRKDFFCLFHAGFAGLGPRP